MKNKVIVIIFVVVFTILCCFIFRDISYAKDNVLYTCKYAMKEDNGWYIYIDINQNKETKEVTINFDGYSFLNHNVVNSYIRVLDENNNIKRKIPDVIAHMCKTDKYRKDISLINKFFQENQYNRKINLSDLANLNIATINKNDIIELYNKAISSSDLKVGPLINVNIPYMNMVEVYNGDNKYLIFYHIIYGNIYNFYIDYVQNGDYLSDKKDLSSYDLKLRNDLDKIKEVVLNNNTFDIDSKLDKQKQEEYKELINRIGMIDNVQNSN